MIRTVLKRVSSVMLVPTIAVIASGCAASGPASTAVDSPIGIQAFERSLADGGTARGMIATIDLADPRLRIEVTGPLANLESGAEALLETPPAWAMRRGLDLAVNANYFAMTRSGARYVSGQAADVLGLCVSDGFMVSPPRTFEGRGDPALLLRHDGRGEIARVGQNPGREVRHAVAGIGGSASDPDRGTPLIDAGADRSATARVEPFARHPRTAAGLAMEGRLLVLVVVDGRQRGWSDGMTLAELAAMMLERGVHDAVNLDGGGSSALVWREDGLWRTNRASEPSGFRAVSTSLGFKVEP